MNKILFIICINCLFFSCMQSPNMKHDLKQLHSKPFIICNDMTITYNGKDSIMNDFFNNSIKFVIYTDSTSRTSCNVNRMDLWNPFF